MRDPALVAPVSPAPPVRSAVRSSRRAFVLSAVLLLPAMAGGRPQDALPDPLQAGFKGRPVCERLLEDDRQRVLRCTFPPGGGHDRHFHAPHFGYALSGGRMRITDPAGVRESLLATGSLFTSAGVAWHEVLNVGETTVQYLIVETKPLSTP